MKTKILNLTQHKATPEQIKDGVVDLPPEERKQLCELLTFEEIPSPEIMQARAIEIARLAYSNGFEKAMIGGAPFLMVILQFECQDQGVSTVFSFSKRKSVEEMQPDGTILKKSVFKHVGFVEPCFS